MKKLNNDQLVAKAAFFRGAHNYESGKIGSIRLRFLILAICGFLAINGPFINIALVDREIRAAAMNNGKAMLFVSEAFLPMLFLVFSIAKLAWKKPGRSFFTGRSLAFNVPFQLQPLPRENCSEKS